MRQWALGSAQHTRGYDAVEMPTPHTADFATVSAQACDPAVTGAALTNRTRNTGAECYPNHRAGLQTTLGDRHHDLKQFAENWLVSSEITTRRQGLVLMKCRVMQWSRATKILGLPLPE